MVEAAGTQMPYLQPAPVAIARKRLEPPGWQSIRHGRALFSIGVQPTAPRRCIDGFSTTWLSGAANSWRVQPTAIGGVMITKRTAARVTVLATTIAIAACSDSTLTTPNTRPGLSRASFTTGAVKTAFDFPVSFEGPLNWVSCLDPNSPPLAHVNGVVHVSTLTTPSGVTTTTSLFEIDRDNTA